MKSNFRIIMFETRFGRDMIGRNHFKGTRWVKFVLIFYEYNRDDNTIYCIYTVYFARNKKSMYLYFLT